MASNSDDVRTDYEQTNEQIRMLTDIRFRLLTLIPSGTIIAVSVLGITASMETALVVGILGFIFVFALAMYDLRNSQIYDASLSRAVQLEKQLQMLNGGLYANRPKRSVKLLGILVWHDRALAVIYGTVLGGWFYLIIYALLNLLLGKVNGVFYLVSILISALVACAFIWHFHQIEATRTNARRLRIYNITKGQLSNGTYKVTIELSLENKWIHTFRYRISELKLLDRDDKKHPSDNKQGYRTKGKLKPGKSISLILDYTLPEKSVPVALVYAPYPWPWLLNMQQVKHFSAKHFKKIILLIRHGTHEEETSSRRDQGTPLTQEGRSTVSRLKDDLASLNLIPDIYLTSSQVDAQETTEILSESRWNKVHPIDVLTQNPGNSNNIFQTIIDQAEKEGLKLSEIATIAIVGHEPTLTDILKSLTSEDVPLWIGHARVVWVGADSLSDFLARKGVVGQISEDTQLGEQEGQEQSEGSFSPS